MTTILPRTVAGSVRSELPPWAFQPARSRLLWVPVHLGIIAGGVVALRALDLGAHFDALTLSFAGLGQLALPLLAACLASLLIGLSFAGLSFVAHEALHGALTRRRTLRYVIGWIGFLPFCISPRLWIAWHNRVHHGNTNVEGKDPDAYPTLKEYEEDRFARLSVDLAAPRLGKLRGVISLLIGFSLQSNHMLLTAKRRRFLTQKEFVFALLESGLGLAVWAAVGVFLGPIAFVFGFVIPLILANCVVMALILTNHSLNPMGEHSEVLRTSLTVTMPRLLTLYTLGFGYHVEHHLFPSMSTRAAPHVRAALLGKYPTTYQSMSLFRALYLLYTTPRVYKTADLLYDPTNGATYHTLGDKNVAPVTLPPPSTQPPPKTRTSFPPPPFFGPDPLTSAR